MWRILFVIACLAVSATSQPTRTCVCNPGYYPASNGKCEPCEPGTFMDIFGATTPCKKCPPGKAASTKGRDRCDPCGKYSDEKKNTPDKCACIEGYRAVERREFPSDPSINAVDQYVCQVKTCPPGKQPTFEFFDYHSCQSCEAGRYGFVTADGVSICRKCPPGSGSKSGVTACKPKCPDGQGLKSTNCGLSCPEGWEQHGHKSCKKCPPGWYKNKAGRSACRPCPVGTVSEQGAAKCEKCSEGSATILRLGKLVCGKCPPGSEYNEETSECEECPPDTFSASESVEKCQPCPTGSNSLRGASRCVECAADEVLLAKEKCGRCPAGSAYYWGMCKECSWYEFSEGGTSTKCQKCERGEFSGRGYSSCARCPPGTVGIAGKTPRCAKRCPPGRRYDEYNNVCVGCIFLNEYEPEANLHEFCRTCPYGWAGVDGETRCGLPCIPWNWIDL